MSLWNAAWCTVAQSFSGYMKLYTANISLTFWGPTLKIYFKKMYTYIFVYFPAAMQKVLCLSPTFVCVK